MSYTLLMRLTGPMQSWGVSSRFGIRETLSEPSKSGAIGLLCAALGWERSATRHPIAGQMRTLSELASLPFGVRVVREGVVRRDYHTAQHVLRAKAKLKPGRPANPGDLQNTVLSERYYLSDAYFLIGFQSEEEPLLNALDEALARPHWPLCLGRKAFIPTYPIRFSTADSKGVVEKSLVEALMKVEDAAWQQSEQAKRLQRANPQQTGNPMPTTRYITDATLGASSIVNGSLLTMTRQVQRTDVPLSFEPRRFAPRDVIIYTASDYVSIQTNP